MDGKKRNEGEDIIRKLLLMAIIEKMESDLKAAEEENKVFARMESETARFVICLN